VAQPYVGEIRMFAGNFAPAGWAFCSGQLLAISENDVLFQLIGTTYGGDGQETFGLPNLQSRIPVHWGGSVVLAQTGGVETVTLTQQQMPVHTHPIVGAATPGNQVTPIGNLSANSTSVKPYISEDQDGNFAAAAISADGGNQPHDNMMPFLVVNYIISLFGIFPSQT
jgi:microcystin-dependent protein